MSEHWVVNDDAAARKCARSFSVPFKGTLAVVIMAKQQRLIPSAAEVIRALVSGGFHLDDAVIRQALAQKGWRAVAVATQGLRFTISEPPRREVLGRLLALNHERYEEKVKMGLHNIRRKTHAKVQARLVARL